MESKEYILSHDFGYGKEQEIAKLELRNIEDVKIYVDWIIFGIIWRKNK